jgi:hypothetical protein
VARGDIEKTADLLHSAAIRLLRQVRKEDAATGIAGAQLSVLSVLVFGGPQTLGIRRPIDRRSIEVSVTEKGRKLMAAARRRRLARLGASLSRLPAAKLALLRDAARLMLEATDAPR